MADKQHTVTPQQKRTLAVMSEAQMRVAHAEGWGRTPNPRDLEVIAHCERLLSRPEPKAKKPSKISTGTVPAPEIADEDRQALQKIAAELLVDRQAEQRTEIMTAMRMLCIAGMPRTEKEARGQNGDGRYRVVFPLYRDRWCSLLLIADNGVCPWGQDRLWQRVIQDMIAVALRRDPKIRKIQFPSYRSILQGMGMNTDGPTIKRFKEAVERLSGCTWRFDFANSRAEALSGKYRNDTRPTFARFSLIEKAVLPSRKDIKTEMVQGETPLPMPADTDEDTTMPFFIKFTEGIAEALMDPAELHIMPKSLVIQVSDAPLVLDFWDFCLQASKRLTNPWVVPEDLLWSLFGQGWTRKRALFEALNKALADLIEAVHPQFHGEFRRELKPRKPGSKGGNPGKTWTLVLFPKRGDIEFLPKMVKPTLRAEGGGA